jgi:hypothetical protein
MPAGRAPRPASSVPPLSEAQAYVTSGPLFGLISFEGLTTANANPEPAPASSSATVSTTRNNYKCMF